MKNYGIYTRASDLEIWKLERISTLEQAHIEQEINSQFGIFTLILGPLTDFPEFVES